MKTDTVTETELGQLFMVGLPGLELEDSTLCLIRENRINNFIIFKRNVKDPNQLRHLCGELNHVCVEEGLGPPLISIDQEGGTVARLSHPFTQFPDARVLAEGANPEKELRDYARTCVRELLDLGINMNLSPVLDVCPVGQDFFMERRSLGEDPEKVAHLGCLIIEEMQKGGLAACVKHFPGLGAATLDPHLQLPIVNQSSDVLRSVDLIPFQAAMKKNVAAIMTSHTIYTHLDPNNPATMSKKIFTDLLRKEMGYEGLVITDDLEMGAIENEWSVAEAGLKAFQAGADLLLICHDHDKVVDTYVTMKAAVSDGVMSRDRLSASIERVAAVRNRFAAH